MVRWTAAAVALVLVVGAGCKDDERKEKKPSTERARDDGGAADSDGGPADSDGGPAESLSELASGGVERKWMRGAALAVVRPGKPVELAFVGDDGHGVALTARTRFAIGSITKVFTSVLLADAVRRGELRLDEPLAKVTELSIPSGDAMTARHLAQHTSGLPRIPTNLVPTSISQPYLGYDRDKLIAYLRSARLDAEPGKDSAYSNLGAALLGLVLAERAGTDYASLLDKRVIKPLGMGSTTVGPPEVTRAKGHNGLLDPTPPWKLEAFEPAGAVWSNLEDMTAFVTANLEKDGPLAGSLALALDEKLGWQKKGESVYWHNGQTGGFHAFVAIDTEEGVGVVVLCNTATKLITKLGFATLEYAQLGKAYFQWPSP